MTLWNRLQYIRDEGKEARNRARSRIDSIVEYHGIPILYASGITDVPELRRWLKKWNIYRSPFQIHQMLEILAENGDIILERNR